MAKQTLLELTQNILSAMSSDEVNSITDTVESQQVAEEIRNTYFELYSNRNLNQFESLINLESLNDPDTPHVMTYPADVRQIRWIKYKNFRSNGRFDTVEYICPEDFIYRVVETSLGALTPYKTVTLLPTSSVTYSIAANRVPQYFTVFDKDKTVVFDSYDLESENFLTGSSALAWASQESSFVLEDDFIPDLEIQLFPHLLAEAKAACFVNLKEVSNSKEEQRARRQLVKSQNKTAKITDEDRGPFYHTDYSRRR